MEILRLVHAGSMAGPLGVNKTYDRVLQNSFWPGLKADVKKFCKLCKVCQFTGKPNQVVPVAPLQPIPVFDEAFSKALVDCVGPLPKTRSGNQFLLTVMCASTWFPEAVPLRKITAKSVVKASVKFFSLFGIPRVIQSDQMICVSLHRSHGLRPWDDGIRFGCMTRALHAAPSGSGGAD